MIVDRSVHSLETIRASLVIMAVADLLQDEEDNAPSTSQAGADQDQTSPFSMFYQKVPAEELTGLREKRLGEMSEQAGEDGAVEPCPVCLADMLDGSADNAEGASSVVRLIRCPHLFHRSCIIVSVAGESLGLILVPIPLQQWFTAKPQCPICNTWYMLTQGTQPGDGDMRVETVSRGRLEGLPDVRGYIRITYTFPGGVQAVSGRGRRRQGRCRAVTPGRACPTRACAASATCPTPTRASWSPSCCSWPSRGGWCSPWATRSPRASGTSSPGTASTTRPAAAAVRPSECPPRPTRAPRPATASPTPATWTGSSRSWPPSASRRSCWTRRTTWTTERTVSPLFCVIINQW